MAAADPKIRLADAALKIFARKPWADVSLFEVARAAKIAPSALQSVARSKSALIGLILARLEKDVARRYAPDGESDSPRERAFDVAMTWFEAAAPHRKALRSLYDGLRREPLSLLAARQDLMDAAGFLLALAEADTGNATALKAAGFAGIVAHAIPAFLDDDKDLTKTMACLDRDLARAENLFRRREKKPS